MADSGRIEQAERAKFQLLLQQITVVLEVSKIGFKICLTYFIKKILISGIFHVCEVTSKVVQGLSRTLFYSINQIFLFTHSQPLFHSYALRKQHKTSYFLMFSGGIGGFNCNIGCK